MFEGGVGAEALEGFLRSILVRLLLAVARTVGSKLPADDDRRLEDGVVVFVIHGVNKFVLDVEVVLLGPLDETRLEVLVGFDQFGQVKVLADDALDDKLVAALIAVVEVEGSDECFKRIAVDVTVVRGGVCRRTDMRVEVESVSDAVQALALHNLGARRGEKSLVFAGDFF